MQEGHRNKRYHETSLGCLLSIFFKKSLDCHPSLFFMPKSFSHFRKSIGEMKLFIQSSIFPLSFIKSKIQSSRSSRAIVLSSTTDNDRVRLDFIKAVDSRTPCLFPCLLSESFHSSPSRCIIKHFDGITEETVICRIESESLN